MQYGSEKVKCPFYKEDTKNSIRCEGVISIACSNNFEAAEKKRQHLELYCEKEYEKCPHAKVLYEKYG